MLKIILLLVALVFVSLLIWLFGPPLGLSSVLLRLLILALIWVPFIVLLIWRRIVRVRRARAIEKGIEEPGAAHPDRREEIAALASEMKRALSALKRSSLGRGRGQAALYALPWYMIVGPPSAGKSTALLASGLSFPYLPTGARGIRGMGGTRNCTWWFADEAILLDTAGRYMIEDEDAEEWVAFLQMLKKHRRKRPLNGIMVAVPVPSLGAPRNELGDMAAKVRARMSEIMEKLELTLPAYVLVTKSDLLRGFVEYFGDMGRDAGQILGFTLPLDTPAHPEEACAREFDLLSDKLYERMLYRVSQETELEVREAVFQFPRQFARQREDLLYFLQQLFRPNPYQQVPILRGVYFTSGTQEGRPIDRVMSEVGRVFGLPDRAVENLFKGQRERKSYFLHDLFTRVIFPDGDLAGLSLGQRRARSRVQMVASAVAGTLGGLILLGGIVSGYSNLRLSADVKENSRQVAKVPWGEADRTAEDFERLDKLRAQLEEIEGWNADGPPLSLGFGMFRGRILQPPVERFYFTELATILTRPVTAMLEERLSWIGGGGRRTPESYREDFDTLKTYLMLADGQCKKHIDRGYLERQLLPLWKDFLRRRRSLPSDMQLSPHLRMLSGAIAHGKLPQAPDEALVAGARSSLLRGRADESMVEEAIAEAKSRVRPFELNDALDGLVQTVVRSAGSVPGCYTRRGWEQFVRRRLREVRSRMSEDSWVLATDCASGHDVAREALYAAYFRSYAAAWKSFLRGLSVRPTGNPHDMLRDIQVLTGDNPPYVRLFKHVIDETSIPPDEEPEDAALRRLTSKVEGRIEGRLGLPDAGLGMRPPDLPKIVAPLESDFARIRSLTGQPPGKADAPLGQYLAVLSRLGTAMRSEQEMGAGESTKASDETRAAQEFTQRLLNEAMDEQTRSMVGQLFEQPVSLSTQTTIRTSSDRLSGSWGQGVFSAYSNSIAGRYPFAHHGPDATIADSSEFLRENGLLWKHYDQHLARYLPRDGVIFRPEPRYGKMFSGSLLSCLHSAAMWQNALFPTGAATPQFAFEVRPQPVGSNVGALTLEIEGKKNTFRNTPEERWHYEWPSATKKHGARLSVAGANGVIDALQFQGEWAPFHLFDAAHMVKASGGIYQLTWTLKTGAQVRLDIRPERTANPLQRPPPLTCPAQVR